MKTQKVSSFAATRGASTKALKHQGLTTNICGPRLMLTAVRSSPAVEELIEGEEAEVYIEDPVVEVEDAPEEQGSLFSECGQSKHHQLNMFFFHGVFTVCCHCCPLSRFPALSKPI